MRELANPDITGGARVVFTFKQHTLERANVLHVKKDTDWTLSELTALANAMMLAWTGTWRTYTVDDVCLSEIEVTSYEGEDAQQVILPCVTNCCGVYTVAPAPGNATSTISWRTSGIGRSKRGRTFPSGYAETNINDDDTIQSGFVVALFQVAAALLLGGGTSGGNLGVYSRVLDVIIPIASTVIENILDSQRRRLPGRGR